MKPQVSIIILNWNGRDDTLECLKSLFQIDYHNYRIILVDNASTDGLVEIIEAQFPEIVLLKNTQNLGFAEGNNVGIRYALAHQHPDYILLLNNDTIVEPYFLSELVRLAEKYPELGMVSPLIYWHTPPEKIWFYSGFVNWQNGYCNHRKIPQQESLESIMMKDRSFSKGYLSDTDYLSGCALLVKTQVIRQIGLLDARFFAYYEDTDWCVRSQKVGWKVAIVPSAKIWHKLTLTRTSSHDVFFSYRNVILLLWKHSNVLQFPLRLKRHIYRTLAEYSWDREKYYTSSTLIPLDGLWAGLLGQFGSICRKMPTWMNTFIYQYIRYLLWIFRYP